MTSCTKDSLALFPLFWVSCVWECRGRGLRDQFRKTLMNVRLGQSFSDELDIKTRNTVRRRNSIGHWRSLDVIDSIL